MEQKKSNLSAYYLKLGYFSSGEDNILPYIYSLILKMLRGLELSIIVQDLLVLSQFQWLGKSLPILETSQK